MIYVVLLAISLALFAASKPAIWKVFARHPFREKHSRLLLFCAWISLLLTIYLAVDHTGSYGLLTLIGYSAPLLVVYIYIINITKALKNR